MVSVVEKIWILKFGKLLKTASSDIKKYFVVLKFCISIWSFLWNRNMGNLSQK